VGSSDDSSSDGGKGGEKEEEEEEAESTNSSRYSSGGEKERPRSILKVDLSPQKLRVGAVGGVQGKQSKKAPPPVLVAQSGKPAGGALGSGKKAVGPLGGAGVGASIAAGAGEQVKKGQGRPCKEGGGPSQYAGINRNGGVKLERSKVVR